MKLLETYCLRADQESLNLLLETKCLSEQVLLDFVSTDFQNRTRTRLTAKLSNKTINLKSLAAELARVGLSDEERVLLIVALWNNQAIHDTAAAISTTASPSGYLRGVAARCRGQPVDAACELVSHLSTNLADIPAVRLLASLVCKLTPEEDRECVHRVRKLHRIKATESMRNVLQLVSCAVPDELCPSSEHSTDLARCVVTLYDAYIHFFRCDYIKCRGVLLEHLRQNPSSPTCLTELTGLACYMQNNFEAAAHWWSMGVDSYMFSFPHLYLDALLRSGSVARDDFTRNWMSRCETYAAFDRGQDDQENDTSRFAIQKFLQQMSCPLPIRLASPDVMTFGSSSELCDRTLSLLGNHFFSRREYETSLKTIYKVVDRCSSSVPALEGVSEGWMAWVVPAYAAMRAGDVHLAIRKLPEAEQCYLLANRYVSQWSVPPRKLAETLRLYGDFFTGVNVIQEHLDAREESGDMLLNEELALCHLGANSLGESIIRLQKALVACQAQLQAQCGLYRIGFEHFTCSLQRDVKSALPPLGVDQSHSKQMRTVLGRLGVTMAIVQLLGNLPEEAHATLNQWQTAVTPEDLWRYYLGQALVSLQQLDTVDGCTWLFRLSDYLHLARGADECERDGLTLLNIPEGLRRSLLTRIRGALDNYMEDMLHVPCLCKAIAVQEGSLTQMFKCVNCAKQTQTHVVSSLDLIENVKQITEQMLLSVPTLKPVIFHLKDQESLSHVLHTRSPPRHRTEVLHTSEVIPLHVISDLGSEAEPRVSQASPVDEDGWTDYPMAAVRQFMNIRRLQAETVESQDGDSAGRVVTESYARSIRESISNLRFRLQQITVFEPAFDDEGMFAQPHEVDSDDSPHS